MLIGFGNTITKTKTKWSDSNAEGCSYQKLRFNLSYYV